VPKHWFSWDFWLEDAAGGRPGDVNLSWWRERGSLTAAGIEYRVSRRGLTGPFVLEAPGREMARAIKVSALRQDFTVSDGSADYTLKRISWWRREFGIFEGSRRIGRIAPSSWMTRRALVTLPETMPLSLQAYFVWLAVLMWKRDSDAAAAAAPPGS